MKAPAASADRVKLFDKDRAMGSSFGWRVRPAAKLARRR
jgi:hypothetical protein